VNKSNIPCIIAGDFNIDLTKFDHIFYREGCNNTKDLQTASGNLWCDLTDHLPNYFFNI